MRYIAGIDGGSGFTKAVIVRQSQMDRPPVILGRAMTRTGVNLDASAHKALDEAAADARLESSDISYVAATGFGRYNISFRDIQITEITSGARGAFYLEPNATLMLDIGSQSTRAVSLREGGRVRAFKTNDKCAAGSGSFIQRAAKYLEIEIGEVGELALRATNPQPISSVCAVLAESEIINLVSTGSSVEDITRGIYDSLADRAALLLKRVESHERPGVAQQIAGASEAERRQTPLLAFIGGVATHRGMVEALKNRLEIDVTVPGDCQYACAVGAALLGLKRLASNGREQN